MVPSLQASSLLGRDLFRARSQLKARGLDGTPAERLNVNCAGGPHNVETP